ncbi:MAG: sodium ion-translocating decarboxylase subunit beta, partial [Thermodesulfobacteriota bacterium]|nr:sodium ion-translocating decarboxylase subunit beta [Thermodesulfobacteriota bacterium]
MDFSVFQKIFLDMGFVHLTFGNIIMWGIALTFIVLAITKNYEPLLLVPIGFGMFIVNLPLTDLMVEGGLLWVPYHYAI